jgi:hypothetical protein
VRAGGEAAFPGIVVESGRCSLIRFVIRRRVLVGVLVITSFAFILSIGLSLSLFSFGYQLGLYTYSVYGTLCVRVRTYYACSCISSVGVET